jgi:Mn2+/Fe2+ NRAMP family transporter
MIVNFTSINPIRALNWSAALNGVIAVPVMVVMMLIASRADIMGQLVARGWLRWLGWTAPAVIVVAMLATSF